MPEVDQVNQPNDVYLQAVGERGFKPTESRASVETDCRPRVCGLGNDCGFGGAMARLNGSWTAEEATRRRRALSLSHHLIRHTHHPIGHDILCYTRCTRCASDGLVH